VSQELLAGMDLDDLVIADADDAVLGFKIEDVTEFDLDPSSDRVLFNLEPGPLLEVLPELDPIDLDFEMTDLGLCVFQHVLFYASN